MRLKISEGNSKIGNIPNLSLTPGPAGSCHKAPCWNDGCYARKSYRMHGNVRKAWDGNLEFYKESPDDFFEELFQWLWARRMRTPLFRMHVAGDIPDQQYWDIFSAGAGEFHGTDFLIFTKRYDLDFNYVPGNVSLVISAWPGLELPRGLSENFPVAYLSHDVRAAGLDYYFKCTGNCEECGHACWNKLGPGINVVFNKH